MEMRVEEMGMTDDQFCDWKLQLKRRLEIALKNIKATNGTSTEDLELVIKDLDETLKKP